MFLSLFETSNGAFSEKSVDYSHGFSSVFFTFVISKCYGKVRVLFFRATTLSFQSASRIVQAFVI